MTFHQKLEEKIHHTQLKIKEMVIHVENLHHEYSQILKELGLNSDQIQSFIENKENFSPSEWEALQNEQKKLDEKLDLQLKNIKDPRKNKQVFLEQGNIQPHWLFVR